MPLQNADFIATHVHPSWRDKADYIFRCSVENKSDRVEWEQMWGKKNSDGSVTLCCIPFFVYGLSLGDIVRIDGESLFVEVIEPSTNITVRAWTRDVKLTEKRPFTETMLMLVDDAEMHSDDLTAFSFAKNKHQTVIDFLIQSEQNIGLIYEIANGQI